MFIKQNSATQNAPEAHHEPPRTAKSGRRRCAKELANRNYISQLQKIADRLDPESDDAYQREDVAMVKERVGILFKMLDKTLPNLRPVDSPDTFPLKSSLTDQAASILKAVATTGKIGPTDATALMTAVAAKARILEVDELEQRIAKLEKVRGH